MNYKDTGREYTALDISELHVALSEFDTFWWNESVEIVGHESCQFRNFNGYQKIDSCILIHCKQLDEYLAKQESDVVEWDGNGFPPVGAVCEYLDGNTKKWIKVKIKYISEFGVVIEGDAFGSKVEVFLDSLSGVEFRKPLTDQQKKEQEREKSIHDMYCCCSIGSCYDQESGDVKVNVKYVNEELAEMLGILYDEGYRLTDKTGYKGGE